MEDNQNLPNITDLLLIGDNPMSREKLSFSDHSISRMVCEAGQKRTIYYDKSQPKLACIVSPTGIKTFALHTYDRIRKKPLQRTIGRYPEVGINQARDIAGKLLAQIAEGKDILEAARSIREEPTVDDLFESWLVHAKMRITTWQDSKRSYIHHIQPYFGKRKISTINSQQVRTWHHDLPTKTRQRKLSGKKTTLSQATANRCLALLRALYNSEAPHLDNPCKKIKTYRETSRDRFLQPDELKRFFEALLDDSTPPDLKDFVMLLLLTGARRSNVMSMIWQEIDFTSSVWTIPATKSKNREIMKIPLVDQAMEILNARRSTTTSVFVFPGPGKTGHIVEPKRAWTSLLQRSDLKDLRLHDLRRTCGSYQAATGSNQAVISKSLGHKSMSTTAVYTRLNLDPVRDSLERAASAMIGTINLGEKIIKIDRKKV